MLNLCEMAQQLSNIDSKIENGWCEHTLSKIHYFFYQHCSGIYLGYFRLNHE